MIKNTRFQELRNLLSQKEKEKQEFETHVPLIIEWFITKLNSFFQCEQGSIKHDVYYHGTKYKFNLTIRIPFEIDSTEQNSMGIKDFEFNFFLAAPSTTILYSEDFDDEFKNKGYNLNKELNQIFDKIYCSIQNQIENLYLK
ncbi:MAG: hypothetical protein JW996_04795 [Candidatus Cloacimonetes bacterium]|nr:hypothetical protein [Candidatus Cloacimonadota bacterium]